MVGYSNVNWMDERKLCMKQTNTLCLTIELYLRCFLQTRLKLHKHDWMFFFLKGKLWVLLTELII